MKWSIILISVSCLGSCTKFLLCQIHAFLVLSQVVLRLFASSLHTVILMRCFGLITNRGSWPSESRWCLFNLDHFELVCLVLYLPRLILVRELNEKALAAVPVRCFVSRDH